MKLKNIFKIILFILISIILLISLSGCGNTEIVNSSNSDVDTKFDEKLFSINNILEKTEEYKHADLIIKNLDYNSYSYTLNVFCRDNNDKQIMRARNKRIIQVERENFKVLPSLI